MITLTHFFVMGLHIIMAVLSLHTKPTDSSGIFMWVSFYQNIYDDLVPKGAQIGGRIFDCQ